MSKLLLGTNNKGKAAEIRDLLAQLHIELLTPGMLDLALDVIEDGSTYQENAGLKARAFAQASGLVTLADDSGLEVEILDGAPGLRSARYVPAAGATDADRRAYLLENLQGSPRPWKARFHAAVAVAVPAGQVFFAEGNCPGEIIPEERGTNGFGYDPIFFLPALERTMAELSMDEKSRLSHRARAVRAAVPILEKVLDLG
ncbi:MAG: RdgB/HAM1 family non-canonical purine NTP pyrophosphatase [Anaerolineales bacterium]|nr:RdgB/HAM1 family non-canonical purine NTP pyrophosphatase [Anaerolineales bacterium]